MTNFIQQLDVKLEKIKLLIKGLEDKTPKTEVDTSFGFAGREELLRAKASFERFALQQLEYQERKALETTPTALPLEEWLKTKDYKSDNEKQLLCKVYQCNNRPKETAIIPLPIKAVKRIIINGKPYVEFSGNEGKAKVVEDIGKTFE